MQRQRETYWPLVKYRSTSSGSRHRGTAQSVTGRMQLSKRAASGIGNGCRAVVRLAGLGPTAFDSPSGARALHLTQWHLSRPSRSPAFRNPERPSVARFGFIARGIRPGRAGRRDARGTFPADFANCADNVMAIPARETVHDAGRADGSDAGWPSQNSHDSQN
jgi:hypothetical protein